MTTTTPTDHWVYLTDADGVRHLAPWSTFHIAASTTLCGAGVAGLELGDETVSGLVASCAKCKGIARPELTDRPLYRLEPHVRRRAANRYTGQIVMVTYSGNRDADLSAVIGDLIGVAHSLTGGSGAEVLVVRGVNGALVTLSLATVVAITNPAESTYQAELERHGKNALARADAIAGRYDLEATHGGQK